MNKIVDWKDLERSQFENWLQRQHISCDGWLEKMMLLSTQLYETMNDFIKKNSTGIKAQCNIILLDQTVIDFFDDVHQETFEFRDDIKACSYLAYWILKLKPIQIFQPEQCFDFEDKKIQESLYFNEKFVATYIFSQLLSVFSEETNFNQEQLSQALKNLIDFFKHQPCTPQSLELKLHEALHFMNVIAK